MRPLACGLPVIAVIATSSPVRAQDWQPVAHGIDLASFRAYDSTVHALRIDLCAAGVRLRATAPGEGPITTQAFGEMVGAAGAINGDWPAADCPFGFPDWYPCHLAMGNDGQYFEGTFDELGNGFLAVGRDQVMMSHSDEVVGGPQPWMREVVSGEPTTVWDGAVIPGSDGDGDCLAYRARTAIGLSADQRTLFAAVSEEVGDSAGMKCTDMGAVLLSIGATMSTGQDNGGSSSMYVTGRGLVNQTTGEVRSLVNHWAFLGAGAGPPRHCVQRTRPAVAGAVRRRIGSPEIAAAWGFDLATEVAAVDDPTIAAYVEGAAWPAERRLVQPEGAGDVFWVDGGVKRWVPSANAMLTWRLTGVPVEVLPAADVDAIPSGPPLAEWPYTAAGPDGAVFVLDSAPTGGGEGGEDPDAGGSGNGETDGAGDDRVLRGTGCGAGGAATGGALLVSFLTASLALLAIRRCRVMGQAPRDEVRRRRRRRSR